MRMGPGLRPAIQLHEDVRIYVRQDAVYLVNADRTERVVIRGDRTLLVNGHPVDLDDDQSRLAGAYHEAAVHVMAETRAIAREGARVGLAGAGIGLKAVTGVFRLILPGYSTEDLERDMERESARIEARAERLEAKADSLDVILEELEGLHDALLDAVPELRELNWL